MRGKRNAYKALAATTEGRGLLGRPRLRWDSNIKVHLTEIG
jgi:hypothetical protein